MEAKNITKEEVRHMADLARLSLNKEEEKKLQKDLSGILEFVNQLSKVDVSEVKYSDKDILLKNISRPDRGEPANPAMVDKMLSQFSEKKNRFLKVKEIFSDA